MKYVIEYEEVVKRINGITIKVADQEQGEEIADTLFKKAANFNHPDDILIELRSMDVEILETCEGAEECTYEVQG